MVKNSHTSAGDIRDTDSVPGLGSFPGEGNGNHAIESCMENSMDRGPWQATVRGVTKSQTQLRRHATHVENA